jgi:hypothetical protein
MQENNMDVGLAENLKYALEDEFMKKIKIFEELTDLKVTDISLMRVYTIGGSSDLAELKITVEL